MQCISQTATKVTLFLLHEATPSLKTLQWYFTASFSIFNLDFLLRCNWCILVSGAHIMIWYMYILWSNHQKTTHLVNIHHLIHTISHFILNNIQTASTSTSPAQSSLYPGPPGLPESPHSNHTDFTSVPLTCQSFLPSKAPPAATVSLHLSSNPFPFLGSQLKWHFLTEVSWHIPPQKESKTWVPLSFSRKEPVTFTALLQPVTPNAFVPLRSVPLQDRIIHKGRDPAQHQSQTVHSQRQVDWPTT